MPPEVRPIRPDERTAWARSVGVPFLRPVTEDPADDEQHWEQPPLDRTWAVVDDDRFVGNAAVLDRRVNLPGPAGVDCPVVPLAAVTAVGVHPSHRRRGLLGRLMQAMLGDAVRRGDPLAGLQASEAAIYGRFGFGVATFAARRRIDTRRSSFSGKVPDVEVRLLGPSEAAEVLPGLFEKSIARTPGQVDRTEETWKWEVFDDFPAWRRGRSANFYAVSDDGYALYRAEPIAGASGHRLHVHEVCAVSPDAEAALWRFLFDIDLALEVEARPRPVLDPLSFRLVDPRALETTGVTDFLWLRVLDPVALLTARVYRAAGQLVLDVGAPTAAVLEPDPAVGRFVLDASPDGASCVPAPARRAADLRLGVAELGTLLTGAVTAWDLAAAGRLEELRPGALGVADALFATRPAPWDITGF